MSTPLLEVQGLCKRFGAVVASDRLDLEVRPGQLHAVIGPNGAGKTTLIAQLAGELRPDAGCIRFRGRDLIALPVHIRAGLGLARSFQMASLFERLRVLDNVALAVQAVGGHSFRFWRPASRVGPLREAAMAALEEVGLGGRAEATASALSHGEKRQLEIAMALASSPELLLLDEPLAGQGPAESRSMIALLDGLRKRCAILLVEHDMDAVFALADRITVLVAGRALASGAPVEIRADQAVRAAYLGDA
jgi:branched-chain amino acid transport system ATP-binding protein